MIETNEKGQVLIVNLNSAISNVASGFSRYNGGWVKTITRINKEKTNGYSLEGDFVNSPCWLTPGTLLLDCSIDGSRKNQRKGYHLLKVKADGTLDILQTIEGMQTNPTWAVDLWESIEVNLPEKNDINPLEKYSDNELIAEMKRRGL